MKCSLTILLSAISFMTAFAQHESFRDVDTLLRRLSQAKTDTGRILLKCRLGEAYRGIKPDTSLILASEALSGSIEIQLKKGEIHALLVLCVLSREKGDLPHALELGLKALKIAEEERMPFEQVYCLIRVAVVYMAVKDIPKAISYLKRAEEILKKSYDDYQWTVVQFFLGDAYEQLNDLDAAEKQVQIIEQKHALDPSWKIISARMRGNIAVKKNDLPLAIRFYHLSNQEALIQTDFREAATASNALALTFKKLGETDSAILYAKQGLRFGEMLSYRNRILAASSLLAELHAQKDPAEAVRYYQIASAAKDSLYGVQKVIQLQSSTIKEQERNAEQEAARVAYKNRMKQWALLGAIAVFLVIALILYRNNRQKQKANKVLETTLTDLRTTQSQLVHAEKMASLGELTAGIAHEIQNPLNFVNNFSDVSNELLEEMKHELEKGNKEDAIAIVEDVKQNLEKISHHGKRADAIVKGMLQHSRAGSGHKEMTDINVLADEYLRFAYHGLRAKDKSFNAKFETDFDNNIGKINVMPQDIGRVILNLINNAFYAVTEKKRQNGNGFEPTVAVHTRRVNDKIEIKVCDNGNGIPQKLLDKIFQPFFTTKPTGQGTGLGLSLAYDIVTKGHGGELKVKTKEGQGCEFIIQLPMN